MSVPECSTSPRHLTRLALSLSLSLSSSLSCLGRYMEWLLTCPVILIALSNLTGLSATYSLRTMKLLSSEQGTLVFGMFAAMTSGGIKVICFILSCFYFSFTMAEAVRIYREVCPCPCLT